MISNEARVYNYSTYGSKDSYGQAQLTSETKGQIKMALYTLNQSIQDNIRYRDATYLGLTQSEIDDTFVIENGEEKLKVLFVTTRGRLKQVFMKNL